MKVSRPQWPSEREWEVRAGAFPSVSSCWVLLSLFFATTTEVCFAQEEEERTEAGTERGLNSRLAKKVEVYMPAALGGMLLVAVLVYCCCKARSASARIDEAEAGADDDIEPGIQGIQLQNKKNRASKRAYSSRTVAPSISPTERISRPAVMSWDNKSSASTSVASTSSRDDISTKGQEHARSAARSRSREGHRVPRAARPASRPPSGAEGCTTARTGDRGRSRRARQQPGHMRQPGQE